MGSTGRFRYGPTKVVGGAVLLLVGGGALVAVTIRSLHLPAGGLALVYALAFWAASAWYGTAEDHAPLRRLNLPGAGLGTLGVLGGWLWSAAYLTVLSSVVVLAAGMWFLMDGVTDIIVRRRLSRLRRPW